MVVTRPRGQAPPLCDALRDLGAEPVVFPTIAIRPPEDPTPLREALAGIERYDWAAFTSVNGVRRALGALDELGRDPAEALGGRRVAAIGPSTADELREAGVAVEVVPEAYRAERLVEAMADVVRLEGSTVLLARAEEARAALPRGLREHGARVDEVTAYRTGPAEPDIAGLRSRLAADEVDWLTFTASSTVRNYVRLMGTERGSARVAAIGPVTAGTARELGLGADVVAEEYTVPGLVDALVRAETVRAGG